MNNKSHEFAFFSSEFSQAVSDKKEQFMLTDVSISHRIQHVLRAQKGETVMFFDDQFHALCTILEYSKNKVVVKIGNIIKNAPLLPRVTVLLPLLKREALDEVVYACRELGVSQIYFIVTDKCSRQTLSTSEYERLERVSIAAAEQSKNFSSLLLHGRPQREKNEKTVSLGEFLEKHKQNPEFSRALKLYADPQGVSLLSLMNAQEKDFQHYLICIGPEGDMTDREKALLQESGFVFCRLGSTILRAQQAAILLAGIIRACG